MFFITYGSSSYHISNFFQLDCLKKQEMWYIIKLMRKIKIREENITKNINFIKYHGCGNDYVYIDCFKNRIEDPEKLSRNVSRQHFGIGSDGLILIEPSYVADAKMRIFNADGSEAKMCGNGIRCVGKYLFDERNLGRNISIETLSGIKYLEVLDSGDAVSKIRVNMGIPKILRKFSKAEFHNISDAVYVSVGNPHCVTFFDDIKYINVHKIGEKIQKFEFFDSEVNVEFVKINSKNDIDMRIFERGSGETLACGTGACASVVALRYLNLCDKKTNVHLLGGDLFIEYENDTVYMTGNAVKVFEGSLLFNF